MTDTTTLAMKDVRPFYGRATVAESPVDEAQRGSGIIVPLSAGTEKFTRGVLIDVCTEPPTPGSDVLEKGMVVYFRGGTRIGDVTVVDLRGIIAYEI